MKTKRNLTTTVFSTLIILVFTGAGATLTAQPKDMGNEDFIDKESPGGDWDGVPDLAEPELDVFPDGEDEPEPEPDVSPDSPPDVGPSFDMGPDLPPSDVGLTPDQPSPDVSPDTPPEAPGQDQSIFPEGEDGNEDENAMPPALLKDEDGGCSQTPSHRSPISWAPGLFLLGVGMLRLSARRQPKI